MHWKKRMFIPLVTTMSTSLWTFEILSYLSSHSWPSWPSTAFFCLHGCQWHWFGCCADPAEGTGIGTSYCLCQQNPEQSRDQLLSHRKRVFGRNLGPGEMAALPRAQTFHCHHGPLSATMGNVFHKNHESPHPMGLATSEIWFYHWILQRKTKYSTGCSVSDSYQL